MTKTTTARVPMDDCVASTTCLCGGMLGVNAAAAFGAELSLMHSLPTCPDYDAVDDAEQAADLLRRCRLRLSQ